MIEAHLDAEVYNADWPKRTPDRFEDLVSAPPPMPLVKVLRGPIAKHLPGLHDQRSHGHRGIDAAQRLGRVWKDLLDGGFTVDPFTGKSETSGYVAGGMKRSSIRKAVDLKADPAEARRWMRSYVRAVRDHKRENPNVRFGGWFDTAHGELVLDHVELYPNNRRGRRRAVKAGRIRDEQSIFHLDTFTEIPTGGTGRRDVGG